MWIKGQKQTMYWQGSKYSILPWLLPKLPACKSWVELFHGSLVVTINRQQSPIETVNDKNRLLHNFFVQLRDNPDELIRLLDLTPYSRVEYQEAWHIKDTDSDLEKARKFFVRNRQSFLATGSHLRTKGWLVATKETRTGISEAVNKWLGNIAGLQEIVDRLRQIQIECRDYDMLIKAYDSTETLFYADPPYDDEKTSGKNLYGKELSFTNNDHIKLCEIAKNIKGKIAISGYDSDFMKNIYRESDGFIITHGPAPKNHRRKAEAREILITNYDPATAGKHLLFT